MAQDKPIRHILSLSGGKDSTALAIFMKRTYPDLPIEYLFLDTGEELPETYAYLDKVETYLGRSVIRLRADRTWDDFLEDFSGFLPSANNRWCTVQMKIKPYERYVGEDTVYSYIGIRADENREGYISNRSNIIPRYPFKEHGIGKEDVLRMLEDAGLGLPDYYQWRTRSGCYFCFFQRRYEWLGLRERHPGLFEKARGYESTNADGSKQNFTWNRGTDLKAFTDDRDGILSRHKTREERVRQDRQKQSVALLDVFSDELNLEKALEMEDNSEGCLVCHL
ncbi:MAG: phosphoadenosine phosphosulfate reductase family protein [Leptospiraceae bacterium]|nr:phosphoadenosine phosphosulfate reductase family protein [Leptospiraceae bacterium]